MQLLRGFDSILNFMKTQYAGSNAGVVNFQTPTELCYLSGLDLIEADIVIVTFGVTFTIGANAGWRSVLLEQYAGTATLAFGENLTVARFQNAYLGGAVAPTVAGTVFLTCTNRGTSSLHLSAESNVAGSSVAAGAAQMRGYTLRGT